MPSKAKRNRRAARRAFARVLQATGAADNPNGLPNMLRISAEPAALEITAAATDGDGTENGRPKLRRFNMTAYSGGPLRLAYVREPVYVDLAGMDTPRDVIPILYNHSAEQIVGHADKITKTNRSLRLSGVISGTGPEAQQVISLADNGFQWQASIGAAIGTAEGAVERIDPGQTASVNGRTVHGPALIVRRSVLAETSFVAIGADMATDARIAATAATPTQEPATTHPGASPMPFNEWLRASGLDPETLDPTVRRILQASWESERNQPTNVPTQQTPPQVTPQPQAAPATIQAAYDPTEARQQAAAEAARQRELRELAAQYPAGANHMLEADGHHPAETVLERALRAGWTRDRAELAMLRHDRPTHVAIHAGHNQPAAPDVMEAALLTAAGYTNRGGNLEEHFSDQTLQAAHDRYRGRIGLQQLLLEAAATNGYYHTGRITAGTLRPILRAAFASHEVDGLLSSAANKFLLTAWNAVEQTWRSIASIQPVSDFKTVTRYRLTGGFEYEEIGPTGEIPHDKAGEVKYENRARTYGRMTSLTREDIINDDLGAFAAIPSRLGRGGALALNRVFWTTFCGTAGFFTSARGNYFEGSDSALDSHSLGTAVGMFRKQTDEDGNPIAVEPKLLLVPPELERIADELYTSDTVNTGGASTKDRVPNRNTYRNKYKPLVSSYLSNGKIAGSSSTAWYLLADPQDLATVEVCFLDGVETPVIESTDADFDTLGILIRGYHDFGVAMQEYRAGVKSKGAA